MGVYLSVVVPSFNEEENLPLLVEQISAALLSYVGNYEVILVDDGSTDATFAVAERLAAQDPHLRVIKFRRNYGQTAAMSAGIQHARGDVIVTMDGDLQNDPADVLRLVELIDSGYDIATGWRRKRQDGAARVFVSKIANGIMAKLMGVAVRDSGCSLKAFRASLIKNLPMYGELHRFIPALSRLAGARLAQIEVNHHPRRFGVSKYGFSRIYKVMLDILSVRMLLSFTRRPAAWHSPLTSVVLALGFLSLVAGFAADARISLPYLTVGVLWLSLAAILISWGMVGQLLASSNQRVSNYATLGATLSARVAHLRSGEDEHGNGN
ncbi:MAG: glycosyltransferase family 2 protein [Sphingobium sp.]|uniref:glycosyltransferase family 2 protein n=1 Tax=Sphingobium sp. TaxID=1912891 RepID=UPI0029B1B325|nr:glycosyltransferase family 2 protein [Sphingobium sp.]MDX3908913.1 glycosyltransferase family 2 protein [Sphingobium sp.]